MNATTISLIAVYAFAAIVLTICILKDMHRSVFRGVVSLCLAVLSIPLAILLTHNTLDRVTHRLFHLIDVQSVIGPVTEAFPSLEDGVVALVHMVVASEIYSIVFLILLTVLGLISGLVCRAIEKKKPALAKKSKPIGAGIGVAFGLVVLIALMAPTAGYAAEAPEVIHILGEYEQITHEGEEDMSDEAVAVQQDAQKTADTALLKVVRALGGKAIFRATTTVEIDGVTTDLYREFHALDALGAKLAVLTAVPVEQYGDRQYDTIEQIADVLDDSALLRVMSAEGLSSLSRAWRNGEEFFGVAKPTDNAVLEVAVDVILKRFENTTKDTVAEDVRKLAPAVSAAIKAFNLYNSTQSGTPDQSEDPSDPAAPSESTGNNLNQTIKDVVESLGEALEDEETKSLAIEIGLGVIGKEIEKYFVTDKKEDADAPSEGSTDSTLADKIADLLSPDTVITQEEYNSFIDGLTGLAVSGSLANADGEAVEDVKGIRDEIGIDLSDELCQTLIDAVLDSPYASLFQ